jgi:hypothetical protein
VPDNCQVFLLALTSEFLRSNMAARGSSFLTWGSFSHKVEQKIKQFQSRFNFLDFFTSSEKHKLIRGGYSSTLLGMYSWRYEASP